MTINFDTNLVADEVPVADALEQHQPTDLSASPTPYSVTPIPPT